MKKPCILPIDDRNRRKAQALRVVKGQEGYIETTRQCLSEADSLKLWRPVGIYDGQTLIGFAMYGKWDSEGGRVWLDRFLIDRRYQGKGYGKAALKLLIARLMAEYGCGEIYLSLYEDNLGALRLYTDFGFLPNGETDINGETVMVLKCATDRTGGEQGGG